MFGGTFDPVHIGHLVAAANARHVCALDRVLLVALGACSSSSETPSLPTVATVATTPVPAPPETTVAPPRSTAAPTTKPALSRQEATKALCLGIDSAAKAVSEGRLAAGGLRLAGAVSSYGSTADRAVADPARRMLQSAVAGDLETSAEAAQEAQAACARAGTNVRLPGGVECVTTPCP